MNQFSAKLLYDQFGAAEESNVYTSVHSIAWVYPGANSQTTARLRLTCIYSGEGASMIVHTGLIEKWRNEGWTLIDEYYDAREDFIDIKDLRDRLLKHAESFLTGVPMKDLDENYNPSFKPDVPANDGTKKPNLSVIEFEPKSKKKEKDKKIKTDKTDTSFDWV